MGSSGRGREMLHFQVMLWAVQFGPVGTGSVPLHVLFAKCQALLALLIKADNVFLCQLQEG